MTKLEYIAKYGQEAYNKYLARNRKWKKKHPNYHKEHCKMYLKNLSRSRPHMDHYKAAHPCCEMCGAPTADAHHIVHIPNDRLLDFGDPILLEGNLMAVCENCHNKLHGRCQ